MIRRLALILIIGISAQANAEEQSVQPYIDKLKQGLPAEGPSVPGEIEPYIQNQKKEMTGPSGEFGDAPGYSEKLKKADPEFNKPSEPSLTEEEQKRLGPKQEGGAIEALQQGRSELHARRVGEIHHGAGVRFAPSLIRNVDGAPDTVNQPFQSVYGGNWTPEVDFFYEFQPFHSEWLGNIGIFTSGGVAYSHGFGNFAIQLFNAGTGNTVPFPLQSQTSLQFFTVPITVGLNYRFNLLRIFRPFVEAGPTFIGYAEARNDLQKGFKGYSKGYSASIGVSLLLDWVSRESTWNYYEEYGVKHYYLTLEYTRLSSFSSSVSFNVSGLNLGLTFEF